MEAGWAGIAFGRNKWNSSVWNDGYFLYGGYSSRNKRIELKIFKAGVGDIGSAVLEGNKSDLLSVKLVVKEGVISVYAQQAANRQAEDRMVMAYGENEAGATNEPVIQVEEAGCKGGYLALCNYMTQNSFTYFNRGSNQHKSRRTSNPGEPK